MFLSLICMFVILYYTLSLMLCADIIPMKPIDNLLFMGCSENIVIVIIIGRNLLANYLDENQQNTRCRFASLRLTCVVLDVSFREQALCRPHLSQHKEPLRVSMQNDIGR